MTANASDAPVTGIVLTIRCPDTIGIVHAVSGFLVNHRFNIVSSQQHDDHQSGRFFMRVEARTEKPVSLAALRQAFAALAEGYGMDWDLADSDQRMRVLLMVSKADHCLVDLLYRIRTGTLPIEVPVIVSNHRDLEPIAAAEGIPFVHLPVTPETKQEAEAALLATMAEHRADLVVLARYMQILSDELTRNLEGRAINIHHSFLPGFKGAKPYHQAFDRGVKLVGATAHYVTADLDEGPIIEQEVFRVDHTHAASDLVLAGRDAEQAALARAVRWHAERRVLLNGSRTVVFTD